MACYRFYSLDATGRICDRTEGECADDHGALLHGREIARKLKKPIEVWEAARRLGLVPYDSDIDAAPLAAGA